MLLLLSAKTLSMVSDTKEMATGTAYTSQECVGQHNYSGDEMAITSAIWCETMFTLTYLITPSSHNHIIKLANKIANGIKRDLQDAFFKTGLLYIHACSTKLFHT